MEVTLKVWEIPFPWLRLDTIWFSRRAFWNVESLADRQRETLSKTAERRLLGSIFLLFQYENGKVENVKNKKFKESAISVNMCARKHFTYKTGSLFLEILLNRL